LGGFWFQLLLGDSRERVKPDPVERATNNDNNKKRSTARKRATTIFMTRMRKKQQNDIFQNIF
jgi:hypothetical protein